MAKHGKKYVDAAKLIDRQKRYALDEAVKLLAKTKVANFDATVNLCFKTTLDPKYADQNLRGAINLPHGSGKSPRVLVFAKSAKAEEAKKAGADFVGDADLVEKIQGGWLDFDVVVATPDMMGTIGRLGKLLGPRGLMPNAKTGTVTMNIEQAVSEIKAGKIEYRVDKSGNIAVIVGKCSFKPKQLAENIATVAKVILAARPSALKGNYIKNVSISSTMAPGIKVDLESLK